MRQAARKLVGASVAAAVVAVAAVTLLSPVTASAAGSDGGRLVTLLNDLRADRGLAPLQVHPELEAIGQRWAEHMAATNTLAHNGGYASQVSSPWMKLGENVGVSAISADDLHQAFIDSPGHYRNLVEPAFTHVGIGTIWVEGRLWVAQQFMQLAPAPAPAPAPNVAAPAPKPAPAPAPVVVAAPVSRTEATDTTDAFAPLTATAASERVARVLEPLRALDGAR